MVQRANDRLYSAFEPFESLRGGLQESIHSTNYTKKDTNTYNNPYINSSNCSCNIHSMSAAVDNIGIVIFRQSSHFDMLLTRTLLSFRHGAHSDGLLILLISTLFLHFFEKSSLHPISFLNVFNKLCYCCGTFKCSNERSSDFILKTRFDGGFYQFLFSH